MIRSDLMKKMSNAIRSGCPIALLAVLGLVCTARASAQTEQKTSAAAPAEQGILPIPDYRGEFFTRPRLAGDFDGGRTALAKKGIQFNVDWVQAFQSVVDGGRDTGTALCGSLDYLLTVDLYRMGLVPGGLLKVRGETRDGDSVNDMSGSILPVNTDAFFPLHTPLNDVIPITITDLTYYQFLSEKFGLVVGKLDTLDSDLNEFASGRGNSQFMNTQLVFSGTLALMPYSTVGGGVVVIPNKNITITSLVGNLTDSSTTTGLTDFGEGWFWASEASVQYRLGKLPGGTNVGVIYAWDTKFFNFNGRFTFNRGEGIVAPTQSDSWMAYWSGWQYLSAEGGDGPVDLTNGEPDRKGFGVFSWAAIADDDVNPTHWSVSGGIGGKGLIPGRDHDFFGIGYYYNRVQTSRITSALGLRDYTQGVECFYNIALTPAAQLSLDAQWIDPAQTDLDSGVILGMRLKLAF